MDIIKLLLFFAILYGVIAWFYIRAKKMQKEAAELEKKKLEQQREEQLRQEAERKAAEEKLKAEAAEKLRAQREFERIELEKKHAKYDAMVAAIEDFPIAISDTKADKIKATYVNDLTYSTITRKSNMDKIGNFVAVDVETTGLKYGSCEIIEIAAIRFRDFKPISKFSTLLAPKKPIPQEATSVNHITDEMVKNKPCFQQIAASLSDFIGSDNIVGHNLPFDLKFIVHYGVDVNATKRKYFDTLSIAQKTIKKQKMKWDKELEFYVEDEDSYGISDYKLETLCSYLDIITGRAHRAEADALATGFLFQKLAEMRTE